MQHLFSPYSLGGLHLANRVVFLPFYTAYAGTNGLVNQQILDHYARIAASGVGLVVVECAVVMPQAGGAHCLHAYGEDCLPGLKKLAGVIQEYGSKAFLQLHHAGRFARTPVGPSPIPTAFGQTPKELSCQEMQEIAQAFASAAAIGKQAGFDGVEIHGATGYLLSSFTSPRTNIRTDEYGGSQENRMRFPLEVVAAVRKSVEDSYPVGYRLLVQEEMSGGLNVEEIVPYAKKLAETLHPLYLSVVAYGQDCLAMPELQKALPEGYMAQVAQDLKKALPNMPIIAAGHLQRPDKCEELLADGSVDLIGLARVLFADPDWLRKARGINKEEIRPCVQCHNCVKCIIENRSSFCARWPKKIREEFLKHAEVRKTEQD